MPRTRFFFAGLRRTCVLTLVVVGVAKTTVDSTQKPTSVLTVPPIPVAAPSSGPPITAAAPACNPAPVKPPSPDAVALDHLHNLKPPEMSLSGAAAQDRMLGDDKACTPDLLAGENGPLEPMFAQYLNSSEVNAVKLRTHMTNFNNVIALLLQHKSADAYRTLFGMATYKGDAGLSRQLANSVHTVWDADAYTCDSVGDGHVTTIRYTQTGGKQSLTTSFFT